MTATYIAGAPDDARFVASFKINTSRQITHAWVAEITLKDGSARWDAGFSQGQTAAEQTLAHRLVHWRRQNGGDGFIINCAAVFNKVHVTSPEPWLYGKGVFFTLKEHR